jgi:hypothetical protein
MLSSLVRLFILTHIVEDQLAADDDHDKRPEVKYLLVTDDLEVAEEKNSTQNDEQDSPEDGAGLHLHSERVDLFFRLISEQSPPVDAASRLDGVDELVNDEPSQKQARDRLSGVPRVDGHQQRKDDHVGDSLHDLAIVKGAEPGKQRQESG